MKAIERLRGYLAAESQRTIDAMYVTATGSGHSRLCGRLDAYHDCLRQLASALEDPKETT